MSLLPFKISGKVKPQTFEVNDGLGHTLEIPKYGCLTVEETEVYHGYTMEATQDSKLPFENYKIELVFRLLCSRFNLPEGTTKKDVFSYEDSPMGETMVTAIYSFFEKERTRWIETINTEGKLTTDNPTGEQSITS